MSLWVFFKNAETYGHNCVKLTPPPPPHLPLCLSPNNVEFRSLRAKTLWMCLLCYWRKIEGGGGGLREGRGGGVNFQECVCVFEALLTRLWKKIAQGHFLTRKMRRHAKFQLIQSNLENCYEFVTWGRLAQSPSIDIVRIRFIIQSRWSPIIGD